MIYKQGDKEFIRIPGSFGDNYYVTTINGYMTTGREGSYPYRKCEICDKIIGTQFNAFSRHTKSCKEKHENKL